MNQEARISFFKMYQEVHALWQEEKLDETINKFEEIIETTPEFTGFCLLDMAQVLAKAGRNEEALSTLVDAIKNYDGWIIDAHFDEKDFDELRSNDKFIEMRERNRQLELEKSVGKKNHYYVIHECAKEDIDKFAVMIHGNHFLNPTVLNEEQMKNHAKMIITSFEETTAVCYVFSSRVGYLGFPYWYNYEEGAKDVSGMLDIISKEYNVPFEKMLLYGHSAGSGVIIEGLTKDYLKSNRFCLFAPFLPDLKQQKQKINELDNDERFFIYSGTKDFCMKYAEELNDMLENTSIPHMKLIEEDQDHVLSKGAEAMFKNSYEFLTKE